MMVADQAQGRPLSSYFVGSVGGLEFNGDGGDLEDEVGGAERVEAGGQKAAPQPALGSGEIEPSGV